jgi:hypothetical protein
MLHNVQVVTTVSVLASSRGILSAEPSMNSTDREAERLARRSHGQELRRRIKSDHLTRVRRIKWQVESGTDSNFEHATLGGRNDTVAIGSKVLSAASKSAKERSDPDRNPAGLLVMIEANNGKLVRKLASLH